MLDDFGAILHNRVLLMALLGSGLAQAAKPWIGLLLNGKLNWHTLVETGGMPSSHASMVTALASGVGLEAGWESSSFAIAAVFAIIVMYDAAGVRWAASEQARVLNRLTDGAFSEEEQPAKLPLKEMLGHRPLEVLVGSIVGVTVALLTEQILRSTTLAGFFFP
jgi:uncharacterized protein